jgi:DNA (cytosine-5)-methyltransferase 1
VSDPAIKPSAVSLFSGCGGFSEGIRLAGFETLAAVEHDQHAAKTYRRNFPGTPIFEDDVAHFLRDGDSRWEAQRRRFTLTPRDVALVYGGPPCQGFSQIGQRLADDPRNQLYLEFVRVLKLLQPRAFLIENVPNMLLINKGSFRNAVLAALQEAGYRNTDVRQVAASDFGVPQHRQRVIFAGLRDDLEFGFPVGDWLERALQRDRRGLATVSDAIGDLPEAVTDVGEIAIYPASPELPWIRRELRLDSEGEFYGRDWKRARADGCVLHNHHTKQIQERRRILIGHLKAGYTGDSLPSSVWSGVRPNKWRRLHPDRPAYTILAQMHRDLSEWVHPSFERWITVREAARLQSFHDGFVFESSEWQMLKQIGNAVPPLLGRALGEAIRTALDFADGKPQPDLERDLEPGCAPQVLPLFRQ